MDVTPRIDELARCAEFRALTQYTRVFDPFRVMGVSTKELLHSRVIAAFFNVKESHGLGSRFRDEYVSALASCVKVGAAPGLDAAVLLSAAGANAKVSRELANIDILLDFPDLRLVIGIENKIHAPDRDKQLTDYQKKLCDLFPHYQHRAMVYLTPTGRKSPTANLDCRRVPIYYQSYAMVADLLKRSRTLATPAAGQFIDQFTTHIERTMTGSSEIKTLCWNVFQQNEEAYERLVSHVAYCRRLKYETRFGALEQEVKHGIQFSDWASEIQTWRKDNGKDDNKFELNVRLTSWPDDVWVKLYKHYWLGVFPYFLGKDGETISVRLAQFCTPANEVSGWPGHHYAFERFQNKTERCVWEKGNEASDSNYNQALNRVREYIVELNEALGVTRAEPS